MPLDVPAGATMNLLIPQASPRLAWQFTNQPLFDGPPSIDQTRQGRLADCFILASLIAILNHRNGPRQIGNMFKASGDSVIVKLYGSGASDPHYFQVPLGDAALLLGEEARGTLRRGRNEQF